MFVGLMVALYEADEGGLIVDGRALGVAVDPALKLGMEGLIIPTWALFTQLLKRCIRDIASDGLLGEACNGLANGSLGVDRPFDQRPGRGSCRLDRMER
jgi:hypothetical protein